MHSKVVLVVSRTHWQCLSCNLFNKHFVSIDHHLKSIHFNCQLPASLSLATHSDSRSYSDSELGNRYQHRRTFLTGSSLLTEKTGKEKNSQKPQKLFKSVKLSSSKLDFQYEKTKMLRKTQVPVSVQKVEECGKDNKSDSDENYSLEDGKMDEENLETIDEKTFKERITRQLKMSLRKHLYASKINPSNGVNIKSKKKQKAAKKASLPKQLNQKSSVAGKTRDRKSKQKSVDIITEKNSPECKPTTVKEKNTDSASEKTLANSLPLKEENHTKERRRRKIRKCDSTNDFLSPTDKSNIATSCVPWLLGSRRKAGDKVTKKSRRNLISDEKQAVRELYEINLPEPTQAVDGSACNIARGESQPFIMGNQTLNAGENFSPHHSGLLTLNQRASNGEETVSSHHNYTMNMLSPGPRSNFMGQENLYSTYRGIYPEEHQQSHNTQHTSEFYPSASVLLSQRSSVMNFHRYGPTGPPVLSTSSVGDMPRHQLEVSGYLGQGFNVGCLPQPGGTSATSHLVPEATQTSVHANFCMNTQTTPNLQPHIVVSCPKVSHKEEALTNTLDNCCSVCEKKFQSFGEYEKHQKEVEGFSCTECKRCKCKFHGLHELNLHVFSIHETEKQGFCFLCNQDITGMENLEKHVYKHAYNCEPQLAGMRYHDCQLCSEELQSEYNIIRTHYYQHHASHVCSNCFQIFKDITAYKNHSQTHKDRPVFCSICGSKFQSTEDLDKHTPCPEDIWAEDGKGDKCFKCGLWCPNRAVVKAHRKQHRSQEGVEAYRQGAKVGFPCVSCEKVFKNKHACRRHVKMVHESVMCYKHYCEYCGKGFLTKGHMGDHIALHHLKIKRYKCEYCSQQFVCGPTLRRHVRKEHTKHKPYQCQHCEARFFEKTPLQRHLTLHTGLAPFMCEHCGKGFYTKHSFTNHGSTHSAVKKFICSGCQKGFTRKYNFQAHTKKCKML